jgi:hypothetical protein
MSDTFTDDGISVDGEPNPVREQREHIKKLEADLETAGRQMTVYRTVPGLSDRQISALVASHDGDWTPDAIKATAVELGFVKEEAPDETTTTTASAEDVAVAERITDATSGAATASPPPTGAEAVKAYRDGLYNTPSGSGPLHLSQQQAEFERVLAEAGGSIVNTGVGLEEFVPA